jgi:hypothetical protein
MLRARRKLRVRGEGQFFCLRCEAESAYELREWSTKSQVETVLVSGEGGSFVFCVSCRTAFELECLDESSTAELADLETVVPRFAYAARARIAEESDMPLLLGYTRSHRH